MNKKRIFSAIGGNVLVQFSTVIIQIIGVPILLSKWGSAYYGEWLLISTIPSYIGLSEMGFGTTVSNEMCILNEKGETKMVIQLLRQSFWFILLLGFMASIILFCSSLFISWYDVLNLKVVSRFEFNYSFLFLLFYVYLSLFLSLPLGFYKVLKIYHIERLISTSFRFIEFVCFISAVLLGYGVLEVSIVFCTIRIIFFLFVVRDLREKSKMFSLLPIGFEYQKLKYLFKPSLSLMSFYMGQSLLNQGLVTIVGVNLGGTSLVMYNTAKTLLNSAKQLTNIVNVSLSVEFSYAFGMRNNELINKLYIKGFWTNILLSIFVLLILLFFGDLIFFFWTNNKVVIQYPFYFFYILSFFINSLWGLGFNFLTSINKQIVVGYYFLFFSLIVLLLNYFLISYFQMNTIGVTLIGFEIAMVIIVNLYASKYLKF